MFALIVLFGFVIAFSATVIIRAKRETQKLNKFVQAQEDLQRKKFRRMQESRNDADVLQTDTINVAPVSGLESGKL